MHVRPVARIETQTSAIWAKALHKKAAILVLAQGLRLHQVESLLGTILGGVLIGCFLDKDE